MPVREMVVHQAFLEDLQPSSCGVFHLLPDSRAIEATLEAFNKNYESIITVFYEMYSESQNTYPVISFDYLKDFCRKTNLLPEDKIDLEQPSADDKDEDPLKFKDIRQFGITSINQSQLVKFFIWAFT